MTRIEGSNLEDLFKSAMEVKEYARKLQSAVAGIHNIVEGSDNPRLMMIADQLTAAVYPDEIVVAVNEGSGRRTVKKFVTGNGLLFNDLLDRLIEARKK